MRKPWCVLKLKTIPATIGINELNPVIPFDDLNLAVVTNNVELPPDTQITIGVNSFGFGGANAHVVLQVSSSTHMIVSHVDDATLPPLWLSAKSPEALRSRAEQLADLLERSPEKYYDIAWTLRYHRERHAHGLWVAGDDVAQLKQALLEYVSGQESALIHSTRFIGDQRPPVFVYSGNGCQWPGMAKTLLNESEAFRNIVEEVDAYYQALAGQSILEVMLSATHDTYQQTELAQPALFALQVGITQLLRDSGIEPAAVTGHSVGEVAAAWASGALTLEQAVSVIYHRSYYQGQTAGLGQMTAVALSVDHVQTIITKLGLTHISIAGINSAKGITLAGDVAELTVIEAHLTQIGARFKRLDLNYAFHSPAMDGIQKKLLTSLASLQPSETSTARFFFDSNGY
ncbi:MAG: acyltransferase domain-containing protein [Nitrincola sp.]|nr:acyltransferase domain-containing protein [Nitrincola sp.]